MIFESSKFRNMHFIGMIYDTRYKIQFTNFDTHLFNYATFVQLGYVYSIKLNSGSYDQVPTTTTAAYFV